MPTDGADFGRSKACYGKAYTAARMGVEDSQVAEIIACGVERDIRRDGGSPAFFPAVDLLVLVSQSANEARTNQLLVGVDNINREFADSPLTRYVASAVEAIGLSVMREGRSLNRTVASELLIAHLAQSRCLNGMASYLTRNRTHSAAQTQTIINSIASSLGRTHALQDLAGRMLNASANGRPAKPQKHQPIQHSASTLNETVLDGSL